MQYLTKRLLDERMSGQRKNTLSEAHRRLLTANLTTRFIRFSFPVQELLRLLLKKHGIDATSIALSALEWQCSNTTRRQPQVLSWQHEGVCRRGVVLPTHDRCIKPSLV